MTNTEITKSLVQTETINLVQHAMAEYNMTAEEAGRFVFLMLEKYCPRLAVEFVAAQSAPSTLTVTAS